MSITMDRDVILLSSAEMCRWFLQEESTIKVIMCKQERCGWCQKFEPIFRSIAPPMNYEKTSKNGYPMFAIIDSTQLPELETRWFPDAVIDKQLPAETKFIKGGNPKFIILSGMKHQFAEKNQLIGCSVGHLEEVAFLTRLELAAPGILDKTTTFAYVNQEWLQKAKLQSQTDTAVKTMAARYLNQAFGKRVGGDADGGGGGGGGGGGECNDPNCPNPNCPRKLKSAAAGGSARGAAAGVANTAPTPTAAGGCQDPNCKNPDCPNKKLLHNGGNVGNGGNGSNVVKWDRKYRKDKPPPSSSSTTTTTTTANATTAWIQSGVPPPRVVKYGGNKTSFATYDSETGLQTFWEHRYPPGAEGEGHQLNETVGKLVKIMRQDHQIPWNSIPDPDVPAVRLSFQTRHSGGGGGAGGGVGHVYCPSHYEGIDAVRWGSAYLRSLDAMSRRTTNGGDNTPASDAASSISITSSKALFAPQD